MYATILGYAKARNLSVHDMGSLIQCNYPYLFLCFCVAKNLGHTVLYVLPCNYNLLANLGYIEQSDLHITQHKDFRR